MKKKETIMSYIDIILEGEITIQAEFDEDCFDVVWSKIESVMDNKRPLIVDEDYKLTFKTENGIFLDVVNGRKIIGIKYE